MGSRKKRRENSRKRIEEALDPTKKKTRHKWEKSYESEDHTEIVYHCIWCSEKKTEKKTFNILEPTFQPHEKIKPGPSEHHKDPRKYTAPKNPVELMGDLIQKNKIFDNCLKNGKITKLDAVGLEEKLKILDRIIPKIIVDECVASEKILEKIQECGYNVLYLGKGLSDDEIFKIIEKQKAVLVTEDEEFYDRVQKDKPTYDPIFIVRNTEKIMENIGVIQRHMKRFEEK